MLEASILWMADVCADGFGAERYGRRRSAAATFAREHHNMCDYQLASFYSCLLGAFYWAQMIHGAEETHHTQGLFAPGGLGDFSIRNWTKASPEQTVQVLFPRQYRRSQSIDPGGIEGASGCIQSIHLPCTLTPTTTSRR